MKKLLLAALLLSLVGIYACRKDSPAPNTYPPIIDYAVLPPATQTGAGTFGCLVDGEVWIPRVPFFTVTYYHQYINLSERNDSITGGITCYLVDVDKEIDNRMSMSFGKIKLNTGKFCESDSVGICAEFRKTNGQRFQSTSSNSDENCIEITHVDTSKNIISGTFNFIIHGQYGKVVISDGRFDVKYINR